MYAPAHRFLVFDRDSKFGSDVDWTVHDMGTHQRELPFAVPGRTELPNVG